MIELKVTAEQPSDLSAQITGLAALFSGASPVAVAAGTTATLPSPTEPEAGAVRERGKPAPGSGRSRRTKEEIAEDEAAERAEAEQANAGTTAEEPEAKADEPPVESAAPETTKSDAPAMSRDEIRTAIVAEAAKLDQSERGAFVQKLLNPFGVTKLGDLPDNKLGALADAIGKLKSDVDSALA